MPCHSPTNASVMRSWTAAEPSFVNRNDVVEVGNPPVASKKGRGEDEKQDAAEDHPVETQVCAAS